MTTNTPAPADLVGKFGWKCNNCQTVFTSAQQERRENDSSGGQSCPYCKAFGQYTYRYQLHQGDPCTGCVIAHDQIPSGPCKPADLVETGWLIELPHTRPTCWVALKGDRSPKFHVRSRSDSDDLLTNVYPTPLRFTTESNEALRFARKDDAEAFMAQFTAFMLTCTATEHQWIGPHSEPISTYQAHMASDGVVQAVEFQASHDPCMPFSHVLPLGPCKHVWAYAPTIGSASCVICGEAHAHGTPIAEMVRPSHEMRPLPIPPSKKDQNNDVG